MLHQALELVVYFIELEVVIREFRVTEEIRR
ncbi:hypothetical protein SNOG_10189 [Parastagonospora nodorum SN15]|uniref:Uncharacterized protein n=1 Tax=Phaeosphaeria nodorum (strain SN15 / ATCC MYA-4574 / FGSC 10173) TaxID=321614 RepID=Q0UDH5_PHANO|nr:hypothetical protein SNOG_10189 [Parastagonospora nodorum SN15]EAT82524.1 hypothetical protein SNOG_10189 [Parastagonospora nodorum SN15]